MAVGNFDLKIPTENISSINPLVFSEFLVVGGWLLADGESWDEEEEGEIGYERVGRAVIY